MRTRTLVTALLTLLAPSAALAAAPAMHAFNTTSAVAFSGSAAVGALAFAGDDDDDWRDRDRRKCGRGNAWGCRRDGRYDGRYYSRYDRRRDYDRWEYERRRRDFYRYDARYRRRDRRFSRFDNQPVACIRAGGRAIDWAVVVVCLP